MMARAVQNVLNILVRLTVERIISSQGVGFVFWAKFLCGLPRAASNQGGPTAAHGVSNDQELRGNAHDPGRALSFAGSGHARRNAPLVPSRRLIDAFG
jgi:hypothetical protein